MFLKMQWIQQKSSCCAPIWISCWIEPRWIMVLPTTIRADRLWAGIRKTHLLADSTSRRSVGWHSGLNGRHPTKMAQPVADETANKVVFLMFGMCQAMPSGLRLYGHPDLLAVAASINGDDFVPYNDATFVKQPGLGGSVSWHQDGVTHWNNPEWDSGIHGFNFQVQLYDTSARSCLWVVPARTKKAKSIFRPGSKTITVPNSSRMPYRCTVMPVTSP